MDGDLLSLRGPGTNKPYGAAVGAAFRCSVVNRTGWGPNRVREYSTQQITPKKEGGK